MKNDLARPCYIHHQIVDAPTGLFPRDYREKDLERFEPSSIKNRGTSAPSADTSQSDSLTSTHH